MNHENFIEQLEEQGIKTVDNTVTAARMGTPPPPVTMGLSPPGAYDDQNGYGVGLFELTSQFSEDLPDPATLPDIQAEFRNNFPNNSQPEQDLQNDLVIKPDNLLP